MEGRQRRSFTDEYKQQAVDLVASCGRSIGSVAKELGLRDSVLRRWVELRRAGREHRNCFRVDKAVRSTSRVSGPGGGLASRLVLYLHPSPCPSPTRGEGTVRHAPSQLTIREAFRGA